MADSKTFPASLSSLQTLADMLTTHGVAINPGQPSGRTQNGGWDVGWQTNPDSTITFTVYKHPFAEEGIMWGKLADVLGPPVG